MCPWWELCLLFCAGRWILLWLGDFIIMKSWFGYWNDSRSLFITYRIYFFCRGICYKNYLLFLIIKVASATFGKAYRILRRSWKMRTSDCDVAISAHVIFLQKQTNQKFFLKFFLKFSCIQWCLNFKANTWLVSEKKIKHYQRIWNIAK